jgi:hypothetical protein
MIKIICKKVFQNIKNKQDIDSIDLFIPLYLTAYFYYWKPEISNALDMMGLFILSVSNYLYYNRIQIPNDTNHLYYLYIGSIHLRYLLCMGKHFFNSLSIVYYSFYFHFIAYAFTIAYKFKYLTTENNNIPYLITCMPCIWDVGMMCINSHFISTSIIPLYISIIIPMIIKIKPFYEWNSVAIHILFIVQSGFLAFCNLMTNT